MSREAALIQTFLDLTDTLVDDFDVVELLTALTDRCVEVLDVSAAGLMLVSADGELNVVASSSEAVRVLEQLELQTDDGPCPECFRTGAQVHSARLADSDDRWPRFAPRAREAGFNAVHALPMRWR